MLRHLLKNQWARGRSGMAGWRGGLRRFRLAFLGFHPATQLLALLGLGTFLSFGIFLGLFAEGFDFAVLHQAAARAVSGSGPEIYRSFLAGDAARGIPVFNYPPPFLPLILPFGYLSGETARTAFQILSLLLLGVGLREWRKMCPESENPETFILGASLILLYFPLYYAIWIGQVDVAGWLLLMVALRAGGRRPWAAGWALALAVALKFFLVFLLFYLALRRRWQFLLSTIAWLLLLWTLSLLIVPWQTQAAYWAHLRAGLGIEAFYDNQSLSGFLHRLLTHNRFTVGVIHAPGIVVMLHTVIAFALLVAFLRSVTRAGGGDDLRTGISFGVVTALLLSPVTDTQHYAYLLPLFLGSLVAGPRGRWLWPFYAFFAVFFPYVAFNYISPSRTYFFAVGARNLVFSIPFFVLAALWLMLARRHRRARSTVEL